MSFADAGGDDVDGDVTLYAKWLSKNTSVTSVTVNEQSATAGDEENTFNVSLPYGSTLPTESSALSVTMAEGATKGEVTVTTDTAAGTVTYSFTVTAEDQTTQANYTVTVSIAPDPAADNKAAVAAAKAAIEGRADWTVAQATVNTQEAVKTWIEGQLEAINLSGVGYEVTITSITPAVAGSADERDGTDGSFSFTVKLSKGEQTGSEATSTYAEDTATVTGGEITATPYNSWTVAVTAEAGGTVSGGGTFENGSTVTVTATPNSGYRFVRWTEGGAEVSTEESYSFTLTADRSLTAEFSRIASGGRPTGPVTEGGASGWDGVEDEIADAQPGDTVTIDMNGETEVPGTIFEEIAGEDVTVEIDLGGGVSWSVNGTDVPEGVSLASLDLGVSLGTSGISVDVINAVTGEYGSVQITLAHDGEFGFALTLTAPLGRGNAGLWANLYHYDEARERLTFSA